MRSDARRGNNHRRWQTRHKGVGLLLLLGVIVGIWCGLRWVGSAAAGIPQRPKSRIAAAPRPEALRGKLLAATVPRSDAEYDIIIQRNLFRPLVKKRKAKGEGRRAKVSPSAFRLPPSSFPLPPMAPTALLPAQAEKQPKEQTSSNEQSDPAQVQRSSNGESSRNNAPFERRVQLPASSSGQAGGSGGTQSQEPVWTAKAILIQGQSPIALVEEKKPGSKEGDVYVVRVGDALNGGKVVEIKSNGIVGEKDGERKELVLTP